MLSSHRQKLLVAIGLLLFVAAAMKVFGGRVDPVQRIGVFSLQSVQFVVVSVEVILAIWLWSGACSALGWTTAFFVFSCFGAVSAYQGWIGLASCGCFGKLTVNPWIAFSLDLGVLAALLLARPEFATINEEAQWLAGDFAAPLAITAGVCAFAAALAAVAGVVYYGSLESALAHLRQEPVSVAPFLSDVGECADGDRKTFTVRVMNHTAKPIRIVGQLADCSCVAETSFPLTIAPHDSAEVEILLAVVGKNGIFTQDEGFYIDRDGLEVVHFRVAGKASAARAE